MFKLRSAVVVLLFCVQTQVSAGPLHSDSFKQHLVDPGVAELKKQICAIVSANPNKGKKADIRVCNVPLADWSPQERVKLEQLLQHSKTMTKLEKSGTLDKWRKLYDIQTVKGKTDYMKVVEILAAMSITDSIPYTKDSEMEGKLNDLNILVKQIKDKRFSFKHETD